MVSINKRNLINSTKSGIPGPGKTKSISIHLYTIYKPSVISFKMITNVYVKAAMPFSYILDWMMLPGGLARGSAADSA